MGVIAVALAVGCHTPPPQETAAQWLEIARLEDLEKPETFEDLFVSYHHTLRERGIIHRLVAEQGAGDLVWYYLWVASNEADAARDALSADARVRPTLMSKPQNHGSYGTRLPCPCAEDWMGGTWAKVAEFRPYDALHEVYLMDCLARAGVPGRVEGSQVYELFAPGPLADQATAALVADPRFRVYHDDESAARDGRPHDMVLLGRESIYNLNMPIELIDFLQSRMSPWVW